jgi:hypothetical protein
MSRLASRFATFAMKGTGVECRLRIGCQLRRPLAFFLARISCAHEAGYELRRERLVISRLRAAAIRFGLDANAGSLVAAGRAAAS